MLILRRFAASLATALLLLAPVALAPAAQAKSEKLTAHPAMWRVKDRDTTIYLLGTVHVLKPETRWFGGKLRKLFDQSDTLVLELVQPPATEMAAKIQALALAKDGNALTTRLTEANRAAYIAAMQKFGMDWRGFEPTKPWMPAMALSIGPITKMGYSAESGVEETLAAAAKAGGKPVTGLETADEQLGYFNNLPEPIQIAFLNATVADLDQAEAEFTHLVDAWSAGKPKVLAKLMNDSLEKTPEIARILISERNSRWADWIRARLDTPGTVFIAVGAGHLAGRDSVQAMLAARGIKSKRVSTR